MSNQSSDKPSFIPQGQFPYKKRLGILLCTVSSIMTLAFIFILASHIVSFKQDDMIAEDIDSLQNFSTAAGSSEQK